MMLSSFKIVFFAFGVYLNQIISCLGDDRLYTISFTTDATTWAETEDEIYFKIYGISGSSTQWFKYDSFPLPDTTYTFTRCLDDIGEIESLEIIRKSDDLVTPKTITIDNLSYTFTNSAGYRYIQCEHRMYINFIDQTHTRHTDSSYCENLNVDDIVDRETCTIYINSNNCENIDGGGWKLVRHGTELESDTESMHKYGLDQLQGTAVYGEIDYDTQSLSSWSIDFSNTQYNQFLFAYGDCSEYLIATKESVIGEYYYNEDRCILTSNRNEDPYYATWYYRETVRRDPYIGTLDFGECRDGDDVIQSDPCKLYGPHTSDGAANRGGSNVWIRQKSDETRKCCDQTGDELKTCKIWGDPHFNTFDNLFHHFQGRGYFDYFKQCNFGKNNDIIIPITITGRHDQCREGSIASCLREVIVTIKDEDGDILISYPTGGDNPIFLHNGASAIGSRRYTDYLNGNNIDIIVNDNTFEVSFKLNYFYDGLIKFKYWGQTLIISTTDCLSDYICGLCGTLDNDNTNDFTRCDNHEIIDNSIVSLGYREAWDTVQEFGETCCRKDFDLEYLGTSDCITDTTPPDETCTDSAHEICTEAYSKHCQYCDDTSNMDEYIKSCEFDVCADSGCQDIDTNNFDYNTAFGLGCLDSIIEQCETACPAPIDDDNCLGCTSGGSILNGDCYALGTEIDSLSSIYGVFACYGEFTGGLNDESFNNICGDGYHVCSSETDASSNGLTSEQCTSVGTNEIFFLKESLGCNGNAASLTVEDNINDVRGCSGAIDGTDNNFIYEKECLYVEDYNNYDCGVLSHMCGHWTDRIEDDNILDQGYNTINEYNNLALYDSNYGGALCCIDS